MAGSRGRKVSVPKEGTGGISPRPSCWTMRQQPKKVKRRLLLLYVEKGPIDLLEGEH